jgi:cation:H+ antiporter
MFFLWFFFVVGLILLFIGSELMVYAANKLAVALNLSGFLVGLVIISIITSLPEATTSVIAQIYKETNLMFGNIIGSNIANFGLIGGLLFLLFPKHMPSDLWKRDLPLLSLSTLTLMILSLNEKISHLKGVILLMLFVVVISIQIIMQIKKERKDTKRTKSSYSQMFLYSFIMLIGVAALLYGAYVIVEKGLVISKFYNISQRVVGITLIAIGTSLPELATSISAGFHKNTSMAIGNVVGSNIFNTLFIVGAAALIHPIVVSKNFIYKDFPVLFYLIVLLWIASSLRSVVFQRILGVILLFSYAIYIGLLI